MATPIFQQALSQFKDAIRAAITRVALDDAAFDTFVDGFAADFATVLDNDRAEAMWRLDGENVRQLGRYLGTIAEMYAVTAVPSQRVADDQLRRALAIIKPVCQLPVPEGVQRREYCMNVVV